MNKIAALLIIAASTLTVLINTLIKAYPDTPYFQVLFLKFAVSAGILIIALNIKLINIKVKNIRLHLLKSCSAVIGGAIWIYSVQKLPIADVIMLSSASIFFNILGATILYKQPLTKIIIACSIMGICGLFLIASAMHVITPNGYCWLPICSAFFFSISSLCVKKLSFNNSKISILLLLMVLTSIFTAPMAYYNWQPLDLNHWLVFIVIAAGYIAIHWLLIKAYAIGDIPFIAPFKLIKFPIAAIVGYIVFDKTITMQTIIGMLLIIISVTIIYSNDGRDK